MPASASASYVSGLGRRTPTVPYSVIVGDAKTEYETFLDTRQQQAGGFETPLTWAPSRTLLKLNKILSLKLDR
ncbi:hypothetical protein BV22DRAFT_1042510, partial [Leucogyrophana mollusca]